jgi:hypothetical protein
MSSSLSLFNPATDLPPDFMLIIYGMRRAGKTTMLLHMLEQMKERFKYAKVHVFSGTADENPAQWKNFPPGYITADIANIDIHIGDILRQQQEEIREEVQNQVIAKNIRVDGVSAKRKRGMETFTANKHKEVRRVGQEPAIQNETSKYEQDLFSTVVAGDTIFQLTDSQINDLRRSGKIDESRFPRRLIVLDDVVNENRIRYSSNLNKLAVSGRHIFISCIILSQSVTGSASVPPIIRRNSDFIMVVGFPRSIHERKMLSEEYLTIGNDTDASQKSLRILKDVTQQAYRAFVISVINSTATEYNQFLFQYGPVPAPPRNVSKGFKLGTPDQWNFKLHHGNREPEYDSEKNKPKKPTGKFNAGKKQFKVDADGTRIPIEAAPNRVYPIYRSGRANADNPFAVDEYFVPNLF